MRYFVAVAEERRFGRAATRLHVTQSTLSTQVQGLERGVGGPVFVRTSRRVELTEAGKLLLVEARRALAQADRALSVARQSIGGEIGAVRIGFSGVAVLEGVLTADLRRFHRAHPRVELALTELPPAAQVQGVRDGTLDVGYSPGFGLDDAHDLVVTRRAETSLSIAVRRDHELAAAVSVTDADLADEDLMVFAADEDEETVLVRFRTAPGGHRARIRLVSGTLGVLALAAAGAGVAVVPTVTKRIALPDIAYRPLHTTATGVDVVTISRPDELSGPVRAFLGHHPRAPRS
ncbi:LysR substrate-binding domain-containing protein [Streptomyces sp. TG1A-8]|uniref:LysR substrate-binding domain-containing protein n=1 Tax=Streptomyces sp. TG1A-8 TaxID=3051385 RepID=UPI00265C5E06|nr:LysR substrate-binding domain-containing protein [Streptomyces sp. TG1A-8]MDO0924176.1 LysR substrate-binding domain-containing protein [Streptomyces sp. TG1A-8]